MHKQLISIITINRNDLKGLNRTFNSVFNQIYQDYEYIIIDGGSDDGSKELIEKNQEKISYWISEPDKGVYNAMNKGIARASGEYILFLNSGDELYDENVLENHNKQINTEDLIYFNINVIGENTNYIKDYPETITFSYLYRESLPHPATFIKKELFYKIGLYDEDLKIVSDWKFFMLALAKYNATYRYNNNTLSIFYLDGISSDKANRKVQKAERKQTINTHFQIFEKETKEYLYLKKLMNKLKKPKKIKYLSKFNIINRL